MNSTAVLIGSWLSGYETSMLDRYLVHGVGAEVYMKNTLYQLSEVQTLFSTS